MPLQEVESASLDVGGVRYILFFASGTPSWCPDCREALPAIEKVFGGQDAPLLSVIKVGMRDEWKSPKNKWRGEPFHISETPCIIKFIDFKEIKRLGDQACKSTSELQQLISANS